VGIHITDRRLFDVPELQQPRQIVKVKFSKVYVGCSSSPSIRAGIRILYGRILLSL